MPGVLSTHVLCSFRLLNKDILRCRAERLEIFDEFEEWNMIQVSSVPRLWAWQASYPSKATAVDSCTNFWQAHYCVAFGINDEQGIFQSFGFPRVAAAPPPRFPVGDQVG